MNTTQIEVGREYVSGNTFAPTTSKVLAVNVPWSALPEREKKAQRTICYWLTEEQHAAKTYIKYHRYNSIVKIWYSDAEVFAATSYHTNDDMIAAYAAQRATLAQ